MMDSAQQKDISSAEMTAIYRSAIPQLSRDYLSQSLASEGGKLKAQGFIERYQYPLVNRKVSARAGYLFLEATRLINSGRYDSVISFASGFSLLTYYIAQANFSKLGIQYWDTDLLHMINERNVRIDKIKEKLDSRVLSNIKTKSFDLEDAFLNKRRLREIFPTCERPIFIIEGVIYFLSQGCVNWLIQEIGSYAQAAILLDYWPDDMQVTSALFKRAFIDINTIIPEQAKSFWDKSTMMNFQSFFPRIDDWSLTDVDIELSKIGGIYPELCDPNQYFPLRLMTAEKGVETVGKFFHAKL